MNFKLLILLFILPLNACKWCEGWQDLPLSTDEGALSELAVKSDADKENGRLFSLRYLEKYFPRALVVVDHFTTMCPDAIEAALIEVVDLLTHEPWHYFKNKPDGFKLGEYWETIIAQYDTLRDFLSRAVLIGGKIHLVDSVFDIEFEWQTLRKYWKQEGKDSYYAFYAHYCDYLVKKFNEAISLLDIKEARSIAIKIQIVVRELRGSRFELQYQEKVTDNRWLIAEFKKLIAVDRES